MKNWRAMCAALAVCVLLSTVQALAQQPTNGGGWGTLSGGAVWEQIENGTTSDLAAVSTLVRVSRKTYGWNSPSNSFAGSGGFCFDINTGGPKIFLVELGVLPWSFYNQQATVNTLPLTGLALLSRAKDRGKPSVVVAPDTRLQLDPGDMVVGHHGTSCGLSGNDPPVTFLEVEGFPTGPESTSLTEYGIEVQVLDPNVGLITARPAAPQEIIVGRLTLPPAASVTLDTSTMPLLFTMEQGTISITASIEGGIVLSEGTPSALQPGTETMIIVGESGYIPPGPRGIVTNAGDTPAIALSVSVIPRVAADATPTP